MPHKSAKKYRAKSRRASTSSVGGASGERVGPRTGLLGRLPNVQPLPTTSIVMRYGGGLNGNSSVQYNLTLLNLMNALTFCNGSNAYIPWNAIKLKKIVIWFTHSSSQNFSNIQLVFSSVTATPGIGQLGSETKVFNADQLGGTGTGMIIATPPKRSLAGSWLSITSVANMTATYLASLTSNYGCAVIIDVEFAARFYNPFAQPGSSLPTIPSQSSTVTGWAGGSFDGGGVLKPQAITYSGL